MVISVLTTTPFRLLSSVVALPEAHYDSLGTAGHDAPSSHQSAHVLEARA